MDSKFNRKVLVVDDQAEVLEDYLWILQPQEDSPVAKLGAIESFIFGDTPAESSSDSFDSGYRKTRQTPAKSRRIYPLRLMKDRSENNV